MKMRNLSLYIMMSLLITAPASGTIRHVPGDYATIQLAIDASVHGDTVLVEANIYYENIDFGGKNIIVGSFYLTTKDTSFISRTVIDGSGTGKVVTIDSNEDSTAMLIGLTIRNGKSDYGGGIYVRNSSPHISRCVIADNIAEASNPTGGGIYLSNSHSVVSDCAIRANSAIGSNTNNGWGGGIGIYQGEVKIENCSIHKNSATSNYAGIGTANAIVSVTGCVITKNTSSSVGGFGCQDSDVRFINNTLANNKASGNHGGFYFIRSSPVIRNSIIWNNANAITYSNFNGWGGTPDIACSDIQGGWSDLVLMDLEPMFEDTTDGNFQLTGGSPCIDAGSPDTTGLQLPASDMNGNRRVWDGNEDGTPVIDMGAYEYGSIPVGVEENDHPDNPGTFALLQSYPNPFNSITVIRFSLPKRSLASLKIYNIAGKEILNLKNDYYEIGTHQIAWVADHQPTGVYICRLVTEDWARSIKLILQR
jgi:hypothetical protein